MTTAVTRVQLERDAVDICAHLFKHSPTSGLVTSWALQTTQSVIRAKVEELSKKEYGLRFHASTATVEQIESSFMPLLAGKIRQFAPSLDSDSDLGQTDEEEVDEPRQPRKRLRKGVSATNTALRVIVSKVVCASVILKSVNKNCNYLQSILGIFVHSANVPQRVTEVLAHAGLSISIKSIQRAVKSMLKDSAHRIKESLRSLKVAIAYDNFDINFKTFEPTLTHQSSFVSATSATAIPLVGVEDIEVFVDK
ncbi:hypothetical protein BJY52DRAFT_1120394 [Lactarius psammicola]|nr:hypothetical protein BJY52DRAFT_1120394 [Lactarius psammicola]